MALLAALALGACGGGGGGGGGASRPASFYETQEYFASIGLDHLRASSAYAGGATGEGVTVAVIDTGIDIDHREFAGAIASASTDIVSGDPALVDDQYGHGTAVAGIVGARRNGTLAHGVAFESRILALRADQPGSCPPCSFSQAHMAAATGYAVARGARVVNYSLGGAPALGPALEAALARAVDDGAILVMAAGNDSEPDPTFPGRFAGSAQADGKAIAVGAVDADNAIADFSNRAGATQEAFLVAPGVQILAPTIDGRAGLVSGTSFAAPHVSGAAALVLQAAPFLSAREVVELLLETATDLGEPGTDEVYGRGLVDLDAALSPQGTLGVPLGSSAGSELAPLAGSGLDLGPAFGPGPSLGHGIFLDGYGRPYRLDLDALKAERRRGPDLLHWLAPGRSTRSAWAAPDPSVSVGLSLATTDAWTSEAGRLPDERAPGEDVRLAAGLGSGSELVVSRGWGLGGEFGLAAMAPSLVDQSLTGGAFLPSHLRLAAGGDGLSFGQELGGGLALRAGVAQADPAPGISGDARVSVAELRQRWPGGSALALQLGHAQEDDGLLEARGGGAFALADRAATTFFGLGGTLPLSEQLELFGQLSYGTTQVRDRAAGLLHDISTVHSAAFALGLGVREVILPGDRLTVTLAQPLRVMAGSALLDRPVGRTMDGRILRRRERIDLAAGGRELDLELGWRIDLEQNETLSLVWLSRLEPDHDRSRGAEHALALRLHRQF